MDTTQDKARRKIKVLNNALHGLYNLDYLTGQILSRTNEIQVNTAINYHKIETKNLITILNPSNNCIKAFDFETQYIDIFKHVCILMIRKAKEGQRDIFYYDIDLYREFEEIKNQVEGLLKIYKS